MPLPNFIIAGPPKTGTTSIFNWLTLHPDTLASKVKETYYFYDQVNESHGFPNYNADGWTEYENLFQGYKGQKIIFEASPGYIYSDTAIRELSKIKNLKLLFVYRAPEERLISEFKFRKYKKLRTTQTLQEFLGYRDNQFMSKEIESSNYIVYLRKWMNNFDKDQLLIVNFTDLLNRPLEVMRYICEYLEIDPNFYDHLDFERKNETYHVSNKKIHSIAVKMASKMPGFLKKKLQKIYFKINTSKTPPITEEEHKLILKLKDHYSQSVDQLISETNHLFADLDK